MVPKPSKTTNRLHFSDLDPLRFEDLCFMMVDKLGNWKELIHVGRLGKDGGADIKGTQVIHNIEKRWIIQCKRFSRITKNDLKDILDKIIANHQKPDHILIILACNISDSNYSFIQDYAKQISAPSLEIWTSTNLESKLYNEHPTLLSLYFGVNLAAIKTTNLNNLKTGLKMKKRILKDLIDHDFCKDPKNNRDLLLNPQSKFISNEVIIRSIDDKSYPGSLEMQKGKFNLWFRTNFYNTYHNGIEFWLAAGRGTKVIMDEKGFWEPVQYDDTRLKDPIYKVLWSKMIGRITYHDILEFIRDGDEYFSEPHIFCDFKYDEMPYEEIYYKTHGEYEKGTFDFDFDKSKRVEFPNQYLNEKAN